MASMNGLVFWHVLADRALQPGAAQVVIDASGVQALCDLAATDDFAALTNDMTAVLAPGHAALFTPEQQEVLWGAGLTPMSDAQVLHCDDATRLAPASAHVWVDGKWYLAPPAKTGQSASRLLALKLVELVSADADTREIEDVFRQDPTLSYHLLRLVNSLAFGASRKISSFSQAILMLGRQQLKRWLNLMLFAANQNDPRAPMLLARVVIRARTMELLALESGLDKPAQELAFMAGMFSLLGVLFGQPLEEIFKPLQVSEELRDAVLQRAGPIGGLLRTVECAEALDGAGVAAGLGQAGLGAAQYNRSALAAFVWMLGMRQGADHD